MYFYNNQIRNRLNYIAQKGYCRRTIYRASMALEEIKEQLKIEDYNKLYFALLQIDPSFPDYVSPEKFGYNYSDWKYFATCIKEVINREC